MNFLRKYIQLLALSTCLIVSHGCQIPHKTNDKHLTLIHARERNTVRVCTYNGCGTGLILQSKDRSKYYLLSVLHLASGVAPGESSPHPNPIAIIDNTEVKIGLKDYIDVEMIAFKESADLALYLLDSKDIDMLDWKITDLIFETKEPNHGDRIYSIGNPGLIDDVYSEGYIAKPYHRYENGVLVCDVHYANLDTDYGASGSGVFDASTGNVVGLVSMMSNDKKMVYIISTKEILQFFQEHGMESEFVLK